MRRLKFLGLALLALCAAAVALATTAVALPSVLPELKTSRAWTGASVGGTELQPTSAALNPIVCKSATGSGEEEAGKPLGTFKIDFKECSTEVLKVKVTCTGLGESSGIILSTGSWHIVYDSLSPLGAAILYLVLAIHFECSTTLVGVPSGGMVLCLWKEPTSKKATHEFACKASATKGKPEETKYYNEAGTLVNITPLLSAVNEGTAAESAQVGNGTVTYSEEVEIMS